MASKFAVPKLEAKRKIQTEIKAKTSIAALESYHTESMVQQKKKT